MHAYILRSRWLYRVYATQLKIRSSIHIWGMYQLYACLHIEVTLTLQSLLYVSQKTQFYTHMGWLWLVGSIKLQVSFAKEPYKRDDILQKRPTILSILLTVATPYQKNLLYWFFFGKIYWALLYSEWASKRGLSIHTGPFWGLYIRNKNTEPFLGSVYFWLSKFFLKQKNILKNILSPKPKTGSVIFLTKKILSPEYFGLSIYFLEQKIYWAHFGLSLLNKKFWKQVSTCTSAHQSHIS